MLHCTMTSSSTSVQIFQTLQENCGTIEIQSQEVDAIRGESNHGTTKGPTDMQDGSQGGHQKQPENESLL